MPSQINLNADMAEGFGAYEIGDDAAILKIIKSANIACGFHAGDPRIMRNVVAQAKAAGVSVGAHPGYNDLWGFGRRRIDMKPDDLEYMVAYQIGALQAMAVYSGIKVTHVKAHGALYNMAAADADYAMAIGRALRAVDRDLVYVALLESEMEKAARALGLATAREGFCDRQYEDDGKLTPRRIEGSVIKDPAAVARQVIAMVAENTIISRNGKRIPCRLDTLCVHGDEPTGVKVAAAAREALEAAGVKIVTIPELTLEV